MATRPLEILIVEPRAEPGRGVAYDTADPAHRLNVPPGLMVLYLDDITHFVRYVEAQKISQTDPEAVAFDGSLYPRRSVFGDYMVAEFAAHAADNPSGSAISHLRARANSLNRIGDGYEIETSSGDRVAADAVLFCTSHGHPSRPPGLEPGLDGHVGLVADPWSPGSLATVARDARVLVLGAGLTGADIVASLQHQGHAGEIVMLSRHGLPPNRQHDFGDVNALLDRVRRPLPLFIEKHGEFASVRRVLTAVRRDIRDALKNDPQADWRDSFDHVRDAGGAIWRTLPDAEKRRYARHLSSYYNSHRNRVPPQVIGCLDGLTAAGRLNMLAGRIERARAVADGIEVTYRRRRRNSAETGIFDTVVNCTGPVHRPDAVGNPFLDDAVARGLIRPDAFGFGIDVDGTGAALGGDNVRNDRLFVAGPLARGYFGDVIGVPQITAQLHTVLPALLSHQPAHRPHSLQHGTAGAGRRLRDVALYIRRPGADVLDRRFDLFLPRTGHLVAGARGLAAAAGRLARGALARSRSLDRQGRTDQTSGMVVGPCGRPVRRHRQ
jgi:uncharacterized NAD(P)/FAD-binding protein YdhS